MASEVSPDQMQARIAAARREAEVLKERIKARKDTLADTSRKSTPPSSSLSHS
jgi:guanine nucleotide-binding protein G(I)/G(S)/G(T) subunit beta-1